MQDVLAMEAMGPEARATMGQTGRAWLLKETSVTAWQDQFDAILDRALSKR